MKTIYEFEGSENPVVDACNYAFGEIEKLLKDRADYDGLIQDIQDKILELKGIMLSECYVPYRIAKLLFELGFNRCCSYVYDKNGDLAFSKDSVWNSNVPDGQVAAPTLQEACRWLREYHDIHFDMTTHRGNTGKVLYDVAIKNAGTNAGNQFQVLKTYNNLGSQEEAIILGLLWSLGYLMNQKPEDNEE
jgi:hypothetical protein